MFSERVHTHPRLGWRSHVWKWRVPKPPPCQTLVIHNEYREKLPPALLPPLGVPTASSPQSAPGRPRSPSLSAEPNALLGPLTHTALSPRSAMGRKEGARPCALPWALPQIPLRHAGGASGGGTCPVSQQRVGLPGAERERRWLERWIVVKS